jgi:ABC-type xylose transport system substrate-binding protein
LPPACHCSKTATRAKVVELNGSPTDNNATLLFKQGYDAVNARPGYTTIVADDPGSCTKGRHPRQEFPL